MMMGTLLSVGTIAGFFIGGKMVDRLGAKPVFQSGRIIFSLALSGILLRNFLPLPLITTVGLFSFFCGMSQGSTGIASTSELLALVPPKNKSLSTGFNMTLAALGISLAGLLNGQLLKMKVFPARWMFFGQTQSDYDILLAGFIVLTALMAVVVGLVPTTRNLRSQWMPQNQ
jgi:MFS family permease